MAVVAVTIPRMLADLVGGDRRFEIEGETVQDILDALTARHPELAVHVFDEAGAIRQHVSVFHNDRLAQPSSAVADRETVVILQAVSGG